MPVGSYFAYSVTNYNLLSSAGATLASNVTKSGVVAKTTPAYTSLTVELAWREDMHNLFISRILSKVGISLSEQGITQYAELLKKEGE